MITTEFVKTHENSLKFLFALQRTGATNMLGAGEYLIKYEGVNRKDAREILLYWIGHYEEVAKELGIAI